MELIQLRSFVAVAEELHFGRAAARLNMTQPPLSRRIQRLEGILSVKLLTRTSRRVELTPAGRRFLIEARRILKLADNTVLSARRVVAETVGTVAIGFTAASGYDFLPRLLKRLTMTFPDVEFILRESVSTEQIEALGAARLDIALLRPSVDAFRFAARCVQRERLAIAVGGATPLAARSRVTLQDLTGERIITYDPVEGRYFNRLVAKVFERAGILPLYVQYVSQVHTVLALVRSGLGVALVPEAARALHFSGVRLHPINNLPDDPVELYAAWRRDNENPALAATLAVLGSQS